MAVIFLRKFAVFHFYLFIKAALSCMGCKAPTVRGGGGGRTIKSQISPGVGLYCQERIQSKKVVNSAENLTWFFFSNDTFFFIHIL